MNLCRKEQRQLAGEVKILQAKEAQAEKARLKDYNVSSNKAITLSLLIHPRFPQRDRFSLLMEAPQADRRSPMTPPPQSWRPGCHLTAPFGECPCAPLLRDVLGMLLQRSTYRESLSRKIPCAAANPR